MSDITGFAKMNPFYPGAKHPPIKFIKIPIKEYESIKRENAELKAKLESVQASAYAESVDAGMRERKLKRALWIARAYGAESEARGWYHSTGYCVKYDGYHTIKGALNGKGLLRLPEEWMRKWLNVERKCRAKAEEYK